MCVCMCVYIYTCINVDTHICLKCVYVYLLKKTDTIFISKRIFREYQDDSG